MKKLKSIIAVIISASMIFANGISAYATTLPDNETPLSSSIEDATIEASTEELTESSTEKSTEVTTEESTETATEETTEESETATEAEAANVIKSAPAEDGVYVQIAYEDGVLPEGATVEIKALTYEDDEEKLDVVDEVIEDSDEELATYFAYDVTIYDADGNEIEPDGTVSVTFSSDVLDNLDKEIDEDIAEAEVEVYHVDEDSMTLDAMGGEVVTSDTGSDEVVMTTDHFSTYLIGIKGKASGSCALLDTNDYVTIESNRDALKNANGGVQDNYYLVKARVYVNGNIRVESGLAYFKGNNGNNKNANQELTITPNAGYTVTKVEQVVKPNYGNSTKQVLTKDADDHVYKTELTQYGNRNQYVNIIDVYLQTENSDGTEDFLVNIFNYDTNSINNKNQSHGNSLLFSSGGTGNGGEWNVYHEDGVYQGIASADLDSNGLIQFGNAYSEPLFKNIAGKSYKQVKRNTNGATSYMDEYYNVKFPFDKYGSYYVFDSAKQVAKLDTNTGVMNVNNGNAAFWPFGDMNNGGDHFGMNLNTAFNMNTTGYDENGDPYVFEFSGDDDVWVYIDGKLVLDLGGIHQAVGASVNFGTGRVEYYLPGYDEATQIIHGINSNNFETTATNKDGKTIYACNNSDYVKSICDGKEHKLQVFYLERGSNKSNCKMAFNLPVISYTVEDSFKEANKTTTLIDWADRTYQVDLTAKAGDIETTTTTYSKDDKIPVEIENPIDVVLALDVSCSMKFHADLEPVAEFWFDSEGRANTQSGKQIDRDNAVYYYIDDTSSNATVYEITCKWERIKKSGWNEYAYVWYQRDDSDDDNNAYKKITDGKHRMIYKATTNKTRFDYLKPAAQSFVDTLATASPNSKVAVVTYAKSDGNTKSGWMSPSQAKNTISGINVASQGGTSQDIGFNYANELINDGSVNNDGRPKYVILLSDGCYNGGNKDGDVTNAASNVKNNKATVFTIGVDLDTSRNSQLQAAVNLLKNCASDQNNYFSTSSNKLNETFTNIVKKMIEESVPNYYTDEVTAVKTKTGTVIDYIDDRFEIVDAGGGSVGTDDKGVFVRWDNVPLGSAPDDAKSAADVTPWTGRIILKAKPNYLGGNDVTTNGPDSRVIIDPNNPEQDVPFPMPMVNVRMLLEAGAEEDTIFLGESLSEDLAKGKYFTDAKLARVVGPVVSAVISAQAADGKTVTVDFDDRDVTLSCKWTNEKGEVVEGNIGEYQEFVQKQKPTDTTEYPVTIVATPNVGDDTASAISAAASMIAGKAGDSNEYTATRQYIDGVLGGKLEKLTSDGKYTAYVVKGRIDITKKIKTEDFRAIQGDPIFTFKIVNTTTGKTYYRSVRFTQNALSSDGSYYVCKSYVTNLDKGVYEVTELDTMRFDRVSVGNDDSITNVANRANSDKSGWLYTIGYRDSYEKPKNLDDVIRDFGGAIFVNGKEKDRYFSDTDIVVNSVKDNNVFGYKTLEQDRLAGDRKVTSKQQFTQNW